MMSYYSAIILLALLALGVLCVLVRQSEQLEAGEKRTFYLTSALIAASALAEWLGVMLDGVDGLPHWPLVAVKCADYILTPMAGGALVGLMRIKNVWGKILIGVLAANALLQLVAVPFGWTVTVGADGHYAHGPLYILYVGIYLSVIFLVIIEFVIYGRSFRNENRLSLYSIIAVVLYGVAVQELVSGVRTSYIALTLGAALMYIHYTEFSGLAAADRLALTEKLLHTDTLTGVQSRQAYSERLKAYESEGIPEDLAVFVIDINGLKSVNDTLGHDAGDELIVGAAACITGLFGSAGEVFRTGGDEFVVIARLAPEEADAIFSRLNEAAGAWHGEKVQKLGLSTGYALARSFPEHAPEQLIREADQEMYKAKAAYYRDREVDRRRR